jgi:hypothetical protein
MWGALIKQIFAYLITRRGKKALAFVGTMLLCFLTAWLIDLRLYLSAAFAGVLAAAALYAFLVQGFRQRRDKRERERKNFLKAKKRAATAQARSEKSTKPRSQSQKLQRAWVVPRQIFSMRLRQEFAG